MLSHLGKLGGNVQLSVELEPKLDAENVPQQQNPRKQLTIACVDLEQLLIFLIVNLATVPNGMIGEPGLHVVEHVEKD